MIAPDENIPSFSADYQHAQSVFYEQFNDCDFYVEDQDQENLYFCILKRLFSGVKIDKIFPLRGKQHLIEHAKTNTGSRKSVYLVDKDFDDLLGTVETLENLFYLDRYCIENFLAEEEALISFIIAEKPRLKRRTVKDSLKFPAAFDEIVRQLGKLFALFYIVQKHNLQLKNTGHLPDVFCGDGAGAGVDSRKVDGYARAVEKRRVSQKACFDLKSELAACEEAFELNETRGLKGTNISGQFVLHFFAQRIADAFELKAVPETHSLTYRLAEYADLVSLGSLQNRVIRYLEG